MDRRHKAHSRGLGLVEVLADMLKSILEWEAARGRPSEMDVDCCPGLTDPAEHVDCFEPRLMVLRGGKDDEHDT